jgi:predicted  nucleic acid-binding Zn-ribbon protein
MATSNNPKIQQLMDEVEAIDDNDSSLEAKLQLIAEKMAEEQQKIKTAVSNAVHSHDIVDPADAFACEGCQ